MKYTFTDIKQCNMCGTPVAQSKVLGLRLNRSQGFKPKTKAGIAVSVQRCNQCSLIYSNPLPIPENIQDHYGIPAENYWTPQYFSVSPTYFASQIKIAKELISFQKGMKALDIGAGIGKCMIALQNAGFDVWGFEPSETFRNKAIEKMNLNAERLALGMIEDMSYETETFDFITFGAVLEHLYNPRQAIEKALKWLKPGGVIQIEVPSSDWLISKIFNSYYRLIGTSFVTNLSPMHEPYHLYEFSMQSFDKLSSELHFEIAHHQYGVCEIYHIPRVFHPILRKYMQATNTGMQLTVFLRKK